MTERHRDDELRRGFDRLREETTGSGRVPGFRAMLDRAKADAAASPDLRVVQGQAGSAVRGGRRRALWVGGWASAALAATIAGVLLIGSGTDPEEEFELLVMAYAADVSTGALRSPTSGLLDVPGMELTRSLPSLGSGVPSLDAGRPPNVPDPEGRDS